MADEWSDPYHVWSAEFQVWLENYAKNPPKKKKVEKIPASESPLFSIACYRPNPRSPKPSSDSRKGSSD